MCVYSLFNYSLAPFGILSSFNCFPYFLPLFLALVDARTLCDIRPHHILHFVLPTTVCGTSPVLAKKSEWEETKLMIHWWVCCERNEGVDRTLLSLETSWQCMRVTIVCENSESSLLFAKIFLVNYRLKVTDWESRHASHEKKRRWHNDTRTFLEGCKTTNWLWYSAKMTACQKEWRREKEEDSCNFMRWQITKNIFWSSVEVSSSSGKRTRWLFPQVRKECSHSLTLQPGAHGWCTWIDALVKNCRRQEEMAFRRCHHKINEGFLSRLLLSLPLRENMFMTLDDMKEIKIPPELVYPILWCRCCCVLLESLFTSGSQWERTREPEKREKKAREVCHLQW